MSTWFKQVANNSLSYLNAQIEPLRHRQKYGKSSEEITIEIQNELQTTLSREKDVERKIKEQEIKRKKIRSKHQELNFRVQNLDENRQFLFKQTTEYEQKLTNYAEKQRNLLMAIDKLKTQQNEIENIKLRTISLNLKGATELKEGTKNKIPKLEKNKAVLEVQFIEKKKKHKLLSDIIYKLSKKSDLLRTNVLKAQKQKEDENNNNNNNNANDKNIMNQGIEIKMKKNNENKSEKENDDDMITIFDNTQTQKYEDNNNDNENIYNLYNKCQKELESAHVKMGRVVLEKLNTEKELLRIKDMIQLQKETLESMENSRIDYSKQQQHYLQMNANLSTKITVFQNKLNRIKNEMKRVRDDIQAIKEASASLTQKKFDLANKLKKTIDEENSMEDSLKILHRNRMSLRSRKSQLLKQQISLYEESDKSVMRYNTQTVQIIRTDCILNKHKTRNKTKSKSKSNGVYGVLTLSKHFMTFISQPTSNNNNNYMKYNIKHPFIDVSHSNLINYSSPTQLPQLLLYLEGDIQYQGCYKNNNNNNNNNCYQFKIQQSSDKNALLMMHNFIETKRDLLYKLQNNIEKEKEKQQKQQQQQQIRDFCIWDIEIEDEFYCDCTSGYELRQIISSCPLRMRHIYKWKLFYSTAVHGISMTSLYKNCENIEESILIIKDSTNCIFGAFIDVPWIVSSEYRGSIDCFVFKFVAIGAKEKKENEKEEQKEREKNKKHKFIVYKCSGAKPYIIRNDMQSITIGAAEAPALYFDQDLNFGRSTKCTTFSSGELSKDTQFQITTLEIWGAINII